MAQATRERIDSLKFMRVIAMTLVVVIHATAVGVSQLTPDHSLYPLYLMLNRFTRFEGAVFVFLSGVVLFYNYEHRPFTKETWSRFYKKRFLYILVPFLLWSVFYEFFSYYLGARSFQSVPFMLKNIVLGQSYYQLYFILILVQLYFLLPVFIYMVQKSVLIKKYLWLLGFTVEVITQVWLKDWITLPFTPFTMFIGSFLLGGWVGMYYQRTKKQWTFAQLMTASIGVIVLGVMYTYGYVQRNVLGITDVPYYLFKTESIIYFLLACYVLFKWSLHWEVNGSERMNRWAENLRIYSFGFYLVHPLMLSLWERVFVSSSGLEFHLFIFIRLALTLLSTYLFIRLIHRLFPRAWWFFGNLPARVPKPKGGAV